MSAPEWGYTEIDGPATWPLKFPQAAGSRQSPVDIDTSKVSKNVVTAEPLTATYNAVTGTRLVNPGYGWKVEVSGEGSELSGGPLVGKYRLEQFHCHWGATSDQGSEHTVDGLAYAAELHLVHWNTTKYTSFAEAATKDDGLAVLGVFLKPGAANSEVGKVVSLLSNVTYRGESAEWPGAVDIEKLLPANRTYWTYQGSLTTPPCTESVTWIVFKEALEVSEEQLQTFRTLRCRNKNECSCEQIDQELILNNYRPPLPLGNRELRECGSI